MIFEKIRERLEELKTFKLNMADAMCELMKKDKLDNYISREEAIDIINQVEAEYNNGWISVDSALPEDESYVLVCEDDQVYIAYFNLERHDWYYDTDEGNYYRVKVEAWQPLPEPYVAISKTETTIKDRIMNHFMKGE